MTDHTNPESSSWPARQFSTFFVCPATTTEMIIPTQPPNYQRPPTPKRRQIVTYLSRRPHKPKYVQNFSTALLEYLLPHKFLLMGRRHNPNLEGRGVSDSNPAAPGFIFFFFPCHAIDQAYVFLINKNRRLWRICTTLIDIFLCPINVGRRSVCSFYTSLGTQLEGCAAHFRPRIESFNSCLIIRQWLHIKIQTVPILNPVRRVRILKLVQIVIIDPDTERKQIGFDADADPEPPSATTNKCARCFRRLMAQGNASSDAGVYTMRKMVRPYE